MRKKPKPAATVNVVWECPACGHQYLWQWSVDEVDVRWRIHMHCEKCEALTGAFLTRIGRNVWAAPAWRPLDCRGRRGG